MSLGALADLSVGLLAAVVLLKICLDFAARVREKRPNGKANGKAAGSSTADALAQIDAKLTTLLSTCASCVPGSRLTTAGGTPLTLGSTTATNGSERSRVGLPWSRASGPDHGVNGLSRSKHLDFGPVSSGGYGAQTRSIRTGSARARI